MLDIKSEPASDVMRNVSIFYYYYNTMKNGEEAEREVFGEQRKESATIRERCGVMRFNITITPYGAEYKIKKTELNRV